MLNDCMDARPAIEEGFRALFTALGINAFTRRNAPEDFQTTRPRVEIHAKIGAATGLDLLNHPEIVNDPVHFLECSAAYWKLACLNNLADAGDFRGETVRANGGLVNYPARLAQRQLWRPMFGLPPN